MGGLAIPTSLLPAFKINKKQYSYGERGNGVVSLWAFGLCLLIYVSIFYVLKVSPNAAIQLFNSTKFWFFISNTLIFIIAADSGALSSSSSSPNSSSIREKPIIAPQDETHLQILIQKPTHSSPPQLDDDDDDSNEAPLVGLQNLEKEKIVCETEAKEDSLIPQQEKEEEEEIKEETEDDEEKEEEKEEIKEETEDEEEEEEDDDDDALDRLSDEELNRRVEDFIQNFNRQIRLQAAPQKLHHTYFY